MTLQDTAWMKRVWERALSSVMVPSLPHDWATALRRGKPLLSLSARAVLPVARRIYHVACNQQTSSLNGKKNNRESRNEGLFWSDALPYPDLTPFSCSQHPCFCFNLKIIQAYLFVISILKFKSGTTWKGKELPFFKLLLWRELILF